MTRSILLLCISVLLLSCSEEKKDAALHQGQLFNDKVQAGVFSESKLAPTYSDKELTPEAGFRVNGKDDGLPQFDTSKWTLEIRGLVKRPGKYTINDIKALPHYSENVRHVCVEGWSMIPKWGGARLSDLLAMAGADPKAQYAYAECADGYSVPYDMPSLLHPQTYLAYEAYNKPLTMDHGAPCRIVMPTKLGYKSAKWITRITITNNKPGGYWEDQGYDWFAGL